MLFTIFYGKQFLKNFMKFDLSLA